MSPMPVQLVTESEVLIREKLASGRHRNEAELICKALSTLDDRDRFEQLRAKVAAGFARAERGELIDYTPELRTGSPHARRATGPRRSAAVRPADLGRSPNAVV